ncbi:MAG: hypothetical protein LBH06_06480 [Rikenellaceae bacterium]|jgi:hypothetical protein|nr:hypothetical protein [Rikenellaceae bacterium]
MLLSVAGVMTAAPFWLISVIQAPIYASEYNRKHGLSRSSFSLAPDMRLNYAGSRSFTPTYGVTAAIRF